MGKRLHNLKRSFSSFHFCRTKRGDAVAPTAAAYRLSPYNPKSRDINFPKFPSPPPTTPDDGSRRRQITNQPQRMAPSHSRSPLLHDNLSASDCDSDSIESARRSDAMWQARTNYANKISLHSCDFGPGGDPDPESRNPKLKNGSKKSGAVVAPCDEGDEETEEEEEEDGARDGDETESFRYSSRSFSFDDTSCEFNRAGETTGSENEEVRLLRRAADDGGERRIPNPTDMRRQVLMGLRSSSFAGELGGGGSMGEAMAVVRKSTDPKGDFKRSMLEMIAEKEIYDAKELEELLQCLLSLNSREYHGDIVEAFSEIWKVIFIGD